MTDLSTLITKLQKKDEFRFNVQAMRTERVVTLDGEEADLLVRTITELETALQATVAREAETQRRHDARVEALETKMAQKLAIQLELMEALGQPWSVTTADKVTTILNLIKEPNNG